MEDDNRFQEEDEIDPRQELEHTSQPKSKLKHALVTTIAQTQTGGTQLGIDCLAVARTRLMVK